MWSTVADGRMRKRWVQRALFVLFLVVVATESECGSAVFVTPLQFQVPIDSFSVDVKFNWMHRRAPYIHRMTLAIYIIIIRDSMNWEATGVESERPGQYTEENPNSYNYWLELQSRPSGLSNGLHGVNREWVLHSSWPAGNRFLYCFHPDPSAARQHRRVATNKYNKTTPPENRTWSTQHHHLRWITKY